MTFQLAAPAGPGACNLTIETASIVDPCVTVSALDDAGSRLMLFDTSDPERTPVQELRFQGNAPRQFDVEDRARLDLHFTVFDGATPRAGARVEDVNPRAGTVNVRFYPFREWACPGDQPRVPRALHAAHAVSGGHQVLIFGGVHQDDPNRPLDPASARDPAVGGPTLVEQVEIYDGRTHAFREVPVLDGEGNRTVFRRVLFHVRPVIVESERARDITRLRVIGGYTGEGVVLLLDNLGTRTSIGTPLVPAENAQAAPPVDLVYDPRGPTLTVEPVSVSADVPQGGFFGPSGDDRLLDEGEPERGYRSTLVVFGLGPDGSQVTPTREVFSYTSEGQPAELRELMSLRHGAAVLPLPEGFLVWGGNVGGVTAREAIGELVPPDDGPSTRIDRLGTLPDPTSFHSWTRIDERRFLIAGGYQLGDDAGLLKVLNQSLDPPIYELEVAGDGSVAVREVDLATDPSYRSTIFHSATEIPEIGVLLLGGAALEPADRGEGLGDRLAPQAQAGLVTAARYSRYTESGLSTARWGHTATQLSGHRLLVVGGFEDADGDAMTSGLNVLQDAELSYWDEPPGDLAPSGCESHL